ncbi:helix-turn-helix transcriptional regulator [Candidatus Sumerlaeota bacterium]|nr:helix-turn-helix transcriptional regulator [Candidatus Sumerlaeota bacterium]
MENILGIKITEARTKLGLTQDQFGAHYGVSGPAIFKFERGYVKPSLDLWMKIAADCGIAEKKAVLLWIKAKLPQQYQSFIDLSATAIAEPFAVYEKPVRPPYARIGDQREMRQRLADDPTLPPGMRAMFADDEFWALYRPTGEEIQKLVEMFRSYTDARESLFREALRLIRDFIRSQY